MSSKVAVLRSIFDVVYETKGTECVRVFLPEGVEIPKDWDNFTLQQKDEWLYERQARIDYKWKDVDRGDVIEIKEIK